ncbi:ROK family protein [Terrimonas ferruginea]|uniref:ROK family protein n=1 Tax=Terrimonas ferruginea TaxID=249 RepID=UPI0003FEA38A|nr:ROK family protein [Terrimonas ferruginea]
METIVAGVDIGGSHITVSLVNLASRTVVAGSMHRAGIDAGADKETIIDQWSTVIKECFSKAQVAPCRIGVAMPGPFDYEQGISQMRDQGKFAALYGENVRQLLAASVGLEPDNIRFTNDAACFLQGELFGGVARNHRQVVGITLGTGFGSAIAAADQVWDANLWQQPFAGKIAEESFSHRGLLNRYKDLTGVSVPNVRELAALAVDHYQARQCFVEMGTGLGQFLAPLIQEISGTLLVIGGNIARAFELFATPLNNELAGRNLYPEIRKTWLGEDATLVGAASLWSTEHALQAIG